MVKNISKQVINSITTRIKHIPFWIDVKDSNHKLLWKHLRNATEILVNIILNDYIISEEDFENFVIFFELELNEIIGFGFDLEIAVHFEMFNEFLLKLLVEEEYFEQAESLKRIMEWYFKIKMNYEG